MLPHDLPPWQLVYHYFAAWNEVYPSILKVWADGNYRGELVRRAHDDLNVDLEAQAYPGSSTVFLQP